MTHSQMFQKVESDLPAKIWRQKFQKVEKDENLFFAIIVHTISEFVFSIFRIWPSEEEGVRATDGKRLKSGNFELKWEWGTELSKVAKNNYFHTVLSETQMVLGQVEVAEHEKNILKAPFCIIQATITPEAT